MPLIQQAGGVAIGLPIDGGTSGSVLFIDGNGKLAQDNTNFSFDDSTDTLTVGGTSNALLNLQAKSGYAAFTFTSYRNSAITHGLFEGQAARGSLASPLAISSGDSLFRMSATGWDGTTFYTTGGDVSAEIDFVAEEVFSSGLNHAASIRFKTLASGANFKTEHLRITSDGVVTYLKAGAASLSAALFTGTLFTGGSGTTNFPHELFQTSAATAVTTWSTSGTFIGINAASGFAGNFLDFHTNGGSSAFSVGTGGTVSTAGTITSASIITSTFPGGASLPVIRTTGALFTGGTGTTNFPQWLSQASSGTTAVTTWSTAGTYFGINAASGFTGNFFDFYINGSSTSTARMSYDGTFTVLMGSAGSVSVQSGGLRIQTGSSGFVIYNGTGSLTMPTDGTLRIRNDGATANLPITVSTSSALFGSGGTYGNLFEFRNSTNPQTLRVYRRYDNASDYAYLEMLGGTTCIVRSVGAGSIANPNLMLAAGTSTTALTLSGTSNLATFNTSVIPSSNDTLPFGGASNRWSNGYFQELTVTGGSVYAANVNITNRYINSYSPSANLSSILFVGSILTGGTGTTNFPHWLIQPTAATAVTTWSTSGTWFGINTATGFAGNFLDFCINGGSSLFSVNSLGGITLAGSLVGTTGSFSGDVTVLTQTEGDSTTKIASTEFVTDAVSGAQEVFVQNDAPTPSGPAIWIQTGLGVGGDGFTIWTIY